MKFAFHLLSYLTVLGTANSMTLEVNSVEKDLEHIEAGIKDLKEIILRDPKNEVHRSYLRRLVDIVGFHYGEDWDGQSKLSMDFDNLDGMDAVEILGCVKECIPPSITPGAPISVEGKCIGYDDNGDLYLLPCTGGDEQYFTHDSDGRIVSQGGHLKSQCVYADNWFWPQLRPCTDDAEQIWDFDGWTITTEGGERCLRSDPSWEEGRVHVQSCYKDGSDTDWFWFY